MINLLLAAALGAASVLAFAPFRLFWLLPLTLAGLFLLFERAPTRRRAGLIGFTFGLAYFLVGVSWVYISLHDFGGMPALLAGAATLLFCAILALAPAFVGYAQGYFRAGWSKYALVIPSLWVLGELGRGSISAGFPWNAVGYAHSPGTPLAGFAPLLGAYGVSWAVALSAGLITLALLRRQFLVPGIALAALWSASAALQTIAWTQPIGAPTSVSLLQGNVAQETKFMPDKALATLELYRQMVFASKAQLIVLPETAFALFYDELPKAYIESLREYALANKADIISGVPEYVPGRDASEYYNAAINIGAAPMRFYRKAHLVPFGEYLPWRPAFAWVLEFLHIPLSDFSRGQLGQPPMPVAGQKLAVNICYENVFGEEIIRALPEATLLANLSNDAWFGHSLGPQQHLQIAQMRALESGRFMLRATNTGVTAIIDQRGRIVSRAPEYVVTTLNGTVQGYAGMTPFARLRNNWMWLLPLLIFVAYMIQRKNTRA